MHPVQSFKPSNWVSGIWALPGWGRGMSSLKRGSGEWAVCYGRCAVKPHSPSSLWCLSLGLSIHYGPLLQVSTEFPQDKRPLNGHMCSASPHSIWWTSTSLLNTSLPTTYDAFLPSLWVTAHKTKPVISDKGQLSCWVFSVQNFSTGLNCSPHPLHTTGLKHRIASGPVMILLLQKMFTTADHSLLWWNPPKLLLNDNGFSS